MENKKTSRANLEKRRVLFFEIGLVITMAITLIAFEWTGSGKTKMKYVTSEDLKMDEEIVPVTRQQDEFRKFIHAYVRYPEIAAENGIAGTVYIQFTIDLSLIHI